MLDVVKHLSRKTNSALRRSRRAADFFVAPPLPPIFGHRRAAATDFLVGTPPTQYIEVSIFSWTVL